MNEKALKITQKLSSKDDDDVENKEEVKESQASPSKLAIKDHDEEDKEEDGGVPAAGEASDDGEVEDEV